MKRPPNMICAPVGWIPLWTCLRVVDGDTLECRVDLGHRILGEIEIRLNGIDTPETDDKDPAIKARAMAAWARLGELVPPGTVFTAETRKGPTEDVYKRFLARVILADGRDVNTIMLQEGHAVTYTKNSRGVLVRGELTPQHTAALPPSNQGATP